MEHGRTLSHETENTCWATGDARSPCSILTEAVNTSVHTVLVESSGRPDNSRHWTAAERLCEASRLGIDSEVEM